MISRKGKRKLIYQGITYYWYIAKDDGEHPVIHISSEDKKVLLLVPFDKELSIGTHYIEDILSRNL
jgi:hypothetical protein